MSGERIGSFEVQHLHGPWEISGGDDELVVLCLVRDGEPWVHTFIEHYFSLGARHLVFLDNGSTDGTVAAACGHDNMTVLRTELSFGAGVEGTEGQNLMRRYLIERFGKHRWSLCVDIDELFDFPYSDIISLDSFLRYLNSKSYTAVAAQMLDMFPERLSVNSALGTAEEFKEEYRFYDISKIERSKIKENKAAGANNFMDSDEVAAKVKGGIRRDVFGYKPLLTKYPLLFSDGTLEHLGVHAIRNARVSDVTCVLLHYKFYAFALQEYWYKAIEYKRGRGPFMRSRYERYLEVLEGEPELHLRQESSRELSGVNDLLENGFLVASEDYIGWVGAEESVFFARADPHGGAGVPAEHLFRSRRQERTKTLRVGKLERELLECQRRVRAKTHRVRTLRGKLADQKRRVMDLEGKLQANLRRLRGFKRRTRSLKERNNRLKQRIDTLKGSRGGRVLSIIHTIRVRLTRPWTD